MSNPEIELLDAERRLQQAQRDGDVNALDRLLDDRLIAIGPDGSAFRKSDDLDGYRSGTSAISTLAEEDLAFVVAGTTGATFALCSVAGTLNGEPFSARLRYARTWAYQEKEGWRIVAAQISLA